MIEGMRARFEVENAAGGVGGVKLDVVVKDDAFSRSAPKPMSESSFRRTRSTFWARSSRPVERHRGRPDHCLCSTALRAGRHARVPGDRRLPWTTEYLPDPGVEMEVVVESLKKKYPSGAKVALATNQTESGQGIANGFKSAIEGTNFEIAAEEALTDPKTAASTLKASGAEVLVVAGVTTDCLAITQAIGRVGWKPDTVIQPSNCVDGATLCARR
ncbi:ABC transporter substrate-binding protein [Rhodococcus sp. 3Y1]